MAAACPSLNCSQDWKSAWRFGAMQLHRGRVHLCSTHQLRMLCALIQSEHPQGARVGVCVRKRPVHALSPLILPAFCSQLHPSLPASSCSILACPPHSGLYEALCNNAAA